MSTVAPASSPGSGPEALPGASTADPQWSALFRQHAPFVWRVLRRLGVAEGDADDVTQDVFVVVHRKLEGFRGDSEFRTWLYGICVRTASDYRRRKRRRPEQMMAEVPDTQLDPGLDEWVDLQRARTVLDRILDGLDEDKRAVFVLFEIEQVPMQDVARIVDCPLKTAYSRLRAARVLVEREVHRLQATRRVG